MSNDSKVQEVIPRITEALRSVVLVLSFVELSSTLSCHIKVPLISHMYAQAHVTHIQTHICIQEVKVKHVKATVRIGIFSASIIHVLLHTYIIVMKLQQTYIYGSGYISLYAVKLV